MIKLNDWEIREPSNTKCYTNNNEAVIVADKNRAVIAKVIVAQDKIVILVDDKSFTFQPESKIIEIR